MASANNHSSSVLAGAACSWMSPQLVLLCTVVRCAEMALHLCLVPVSAVFVFLLLRTSVMHRNLKFILLCQCWSNGQYALSRCVQILNKLIFDVDFFAELKGVQMSVLFTELFGSIIGHALLLERILATVFVSKYENYKKPWLSAISFVVMFALSLQNAYQQAFSASVLDVTVGTMVTLYATLGLSLAEILITVALGYYNEKQYNLSTLLYYKHSLSERYQLSENIRTGRQLLPTFVFHFVNILMTSGITILFYYFPVDDAATIDFLFIWVFSITAFCNLMIEVTVIVFHPIMHRNLMDLLHRWRTAIFGGSLAKVEPLGTQRNGAGPKAIDGRVLIERGQNNEHYYKQLRQAWS